MPLEAEIQDVVLALWGLKLTNRLPVEAEVHTCPVEAEIPVLSVCPVEAEIHTIGNYLLISLKTLVARSFHSHDHHLFTPVTWQHVRNVDQVSKPQPHQLPGMVNADGGAINSR